MPVLHADSYNRGQWVLGSALRAHWARHEVCTLGRGGRSDFQWEPTDGEMDATALEGIGTVVHLAGESLGPGRWTAGKKARIRESRIQGTKLLCQQIAQSDSPPKVLLAASGIGFTATAGIRRWTNRHRKVRGFWQSCAENGRRRPGRLRKSAFGWFICGWGLYWVRRRRFGGYAVAIPVRLGWATGFRTAVDAVDWVGRYGACGGFLDDER